MIFPFEIDGESFRWPQVDLKAYNSSGTQSSGMSKQILFDVDENLPVEIRYFEAKAGGYSALELHQHVHGVIILRGKGHALLGSEIQPVKAFDRIFVPPATWHQFYADEGEKLGFICIVKGERDKPARPTQEQITELQKNPAICDYLRY
ncbi:MAG: cupin domain-containing protein [Spirochaetales bacterium]|nr:cupin domain-containing protein [Spirochaetales bacterium]